MAFNRENGTLRFWRARPTTYDERVDSVVNDTSIININYLGKSMIMDIYLHIRSNTFRFFYIPTSFIIVGR
jgi:hypothetical protein